MNATKTPSGAEQPDAARMLAPEGHHTEASGD